MMGFDTALGAALGTDVRIHKLSFFDRVANGIVRPALFEIAFAPSLSSRLGLSGIERGIYSLPLSVCLKVSGAISLLPIIHARLARRQITVAHFWIAVEVVYRQLFSASLTDQNGMSEVSSVAFGSYGSCFGGDGISCSSPASTIKPDLA